MHCLNCYHEFIGDFCPLCGQKSTTKRLTFLSIVNDFFTAVANTDRGLLKTMLDLSKNPGAMLNKYLEGKRQRYFSAAKYTLLIVVIFTVNINAIENHFGFFAGLTRRIDQLSVEQNGKDIKFSTKDKNNKESDYNFSVGPMKSTKDAKKTNGFSVGVTVPVPETAITKAIAKKQAKNEPPPPASTNTKDTEGSFKLDLNLFGKRIDKNVTQQELLDFIKRLLPYYHSTLFDLLNVLIILWIPISAIFSYLIFFRSPLNFAEHLTVNSYIYAQILLIFTVLSPAYWIFPNVPGTTFNVSLICGFFYLVFAYMQVFKTRSYRMIKTITALSFSLAVYSLTIVVGLFTLALYIAVENSELL